MVVKLKRMSGSSTLPFLLIVLSAFLFTACGTTDPPSTRNTMTAIVDNASWRAVDVTAQRDSGRLVIEGVSAIDIAIALRLHGDTAGTYQLGAILNEGHYVDGGSQWTAHGVNAGSVTVTHIDSLRVAGYFGFRAKDTTEFRGQVEIASGTFDIDFLP